MLNVFFYLRNNRLFVIWLEFFLSWSFLSFSYSSSLCFVFRGWNSFSVMPRNHWHFTFVVETMWHFRLLPSTHEFTYFVFWSTLFFAHLYVCVIVLPCFIICLRCCYRCVWKTENETIFRSINSIYFYFGFYITLIQLKLISFLYVWKFAIVYLPLFCSKKRIQYVQYAAFHHDLTNIFLCFKFVIILDLDW